MACSWVCGLIYLVFLLLPNRCCCPIFSTLLTSNSNGTGHFFSRHIIIHLVLPKMRCLIEPALKFRYSKKVPKFSKSSPYFWLALHRTKVRWRFLKILWPSQNIWTLFFNEIFHKLKNNIVRMLFLKWFHPIVHIAMKWVYIIANQLHADLIFRVSWRSKDMKSHVEHSKF